MSKNTINMTAIVVRINIIPADVQWPLINANKLISSNFDIFQTPIAPAILPGHD